MLPPKKPEFALIDRLARQVTRAEDILLGIGDDAALVRWPESRLGLITTDMLLEGVHFEIPPATPFEVGRKCMGVNLSDIAAMAGRPRFAVVSLALSHQHPPELAEELFRGMQSIAAEFDTHIIGGDTNAWRGPLVINVAVIGEPIGSSTVTRSGAKVGDWIFVTGELGGSLLGRQFHFTPRVHEAAALFERVTLHAMLDVSDGLIGDLFHILEESRCGAVLKSAAIPIHADAHQMSGSRSALQHALSDGEDFELLFTVSPEDGAKLLSECPFGTRLSLIGEIVSEPGCWLRHEDGAIEVLPRLGWNHDVAVKVNTPAATAASEDR